MYHGALLSLTADNFTRISVNVWNKNWIPKMYISSLVFICNKSLKVKKTKRNFNWIISLSCLFCFLRKCSICWADCFVLLWKPGFMKPLWVKLSCGRRSEMGISIYFGITNLSFQEYDSRFPSRQMYRRRRKNFWIFPQLHNENVAVWERLFPGLFLHRRGQKVDREQGQVSRALRLQLLCRSAMFWRQTVWRKKNDVWAFVCENYCNQNKPVGKI